VVYYAPYIAICNSMIYYLSLVVRHLSVAQGSPLEDEKDEDNERIPNNELNEGLFHLENNKLKDQLAGGI
jgi:hypothetical protein